MRVTNISVMIFGQDGVKKFIQHCKLYRNDTIRNEWPMAQILKTFSYKEGLVRSAQLVVGKNSSTSKEMSVFE